MDEMNNDSLQKPTRITTALITLIDYIYTNNL